MFFKDIQWQWIALIFNEQLILSLKWVVHPKIFSLNIQSHIPDIKIKEFCWEVFMCFILSDDHDIFVAASVLQRKLIFWLYFLCWITTQSNIKPKLEVLKNKRVILVKS